MMVRLISVALFTTSAVSPAWTAQAPGEKPDSAAHLSLTNVPAAGRQESLLEITRFGRYAVTVSSRQGTALQIIDRMSGPGSTEGITGAQDGRIDMFLDHGEYKVVTSGPERGAGEATLDVHPFEELNTAPPLLVELKPVSGSLDDFQQLSYWVEVTQARHVLLEAAGRNLSDLRMWKEGDWLVDVAPTSETVQPQTGQPLRIYRLAAHLQPGWYLLTAYGGPSEPWANDNNEHPFHLRFGIPTRGEAGRSRHTVSPFGYDRWLVPRGATFFRLELPEARPAVLDVGWHDVQDPWRQGQTKSIEKNSVPPVAEIQVEGNQAGFHQVKVSGEAGQPYTLQHFELRYTYTFNRSGEYWLSSVHSGHPSDSVDATAVVVSSDRPARYAQPFLTQAVEVDSKKGWGRRANLLAPLSLYVDIKETGRYTIVSEGVEARFRIEPFLLSRPPGYEPPPLRESGFVWDLEAGLYVMTVEPVLKGIVDMAIRPVGMLDSVLELIGLKPDSRREPVRASVRFPRVRLSSDVHYTLYLNEQPEVKSGIILRQLPLDLTEPLPITQRPGETVSAPFRVEESGTVLAEAEDGSFLDISLDSGLWQNEATATPGEHSVTVRVTGDETRVYSLYFLPDRLRIDTPLPTLPDTASPLPPQSLTVLTEDAPQYFELDRRQSETFLVRSREPGIYRLETSGLLATQGNLRTRTITSFDRQEANGVGRNFLIQQYLRDGDYQITVETLGQSQGHLGLSLSRTHLVDGGTLTETASARVSLPAGEAVAYRFTISRPGRYQLGALGLNRRFRCRLEDEDGWPIEPPNITADMERYFEPGTYRLLLLPEPVETRRVTYLRPVAEPLRFDGHGPHRLPLAATVDHLWLESEPGGERIPDVWEFSTPAPVDVSIQLTNEMQGLLKRLGDDGSTENVAYIPPKRGWEGKLDTGHYRLGVTCVRVNNRVDYTVSVFPHQLVAGLTKRINAPSTVPVSVGNESLIEIASFGSSDVRARLYDADGGLVAQSDDRPDDWNFQISKRLPAGAYRLRVDPVGAQSGSCEVSLRAPEERVQEALGLPVETVIRPGRAVHLYPLDVSSGADLIVVDAQSVENIGGSLEVSREDSWRTLGSAVGRHARLEVPLPPLTEDEQRPPQYRLRLWSEDRRGSPIRLHVVALPAPRKPEPGPDGIIDLEPVQLGDMWIGVASMSLDRPGVFRLPEVPDIRWSSSIHQPLRPALNGLATAGERTLWLVRDLPGPKSNRNLPISRFFLPPGIERGMTLRVGPDELAAFDLEKTEKGPMIAITTSMVGQPGIQLIGDRKNLPREPTGGAMGVGARSALSVTLNADHPMALVWQAQATGESQDVRIEQLSFPKPERESMDWGTTDGFAEGTTVQVFDIPDGAKKLRLVLGEAMVAALSDGDAVRSVHWTGGRPFEETWVSDATRLTLFHIRDSEDRYSIEILPSPGKELTLAEGVPFEQALPRAGTLRLEVPAVNRPGKDDRQVRRIHVRGADADPILVSDDGTVQRGIDLPVHSNGGTLLIPHLPGLVLGWVDTPDGAGADLWGRVEVPGALRIEPPATVPLEGAAQAFALELRYPSVLHLRTAAPVVTRIVREDAPPEIEIHPLGAAIDKYVSGGAVEILVRTLGDGPLWGEAVFTRTDVSPIGEGLGPRVLLSAGSTRLFSFEVSLAGSIGIGVRAEPEVVECELLDLSGRRLGSGVVQMPELEPGTYLLALRAPANVTTVQARPALAGVEHPTSDPPEEVVRRYMELAGMRSLPEKNEDTR